MSDFQEEVYIIEKKEISDDDFEDEDFAQLQAEVDNIDDLVDEEDGDDDKDLNDFNMLKAKTENKATTRKNASQTNTSLLSSQRVLNAKTTEKQVVIDDFIRNFLTQLNMNKTMNTFQQEWFEL